MNIGRLVDEINASNRFIQHLVQAKNRSDSLNLVLVEGNTDDVPISRTNVRNNWDLSVLRGSSVVQTLQNNYGVDPKRLTAGGRGEYNPIATNNTPEGRARNRRTQIIITPELNQFLELIEQAPPRID